MPPLTLLKRPTDPPPAALAPRELDPAVLAQARAGAPRAARALVELYQARVFAIVGRTLGPGRAHRVEDLCQECFLRVFRALPSFDPHGPARLSTWICTIATRLCLDELRRGRGRTEELPLDLATPALGESAAAHGQLRRRVELALESLPPDQRATFVLRVHGELSVEETAQALGVDEGTVKSRLSRARAQLRIMLGVEGEAP